MTDEEMAKERFCAHSAKSLGRSQCVGCKFENDFTCSLLPHKEFGKYMCNSEICPHKVTE